MNKNARGFVVVSIILLATAGAYIYYRKIQQPDLSTKEGMAAYLIKNKLASNVKALLTFDPAFLDAWINGHKSGASSFMYNSKSYRVLGGTAI